MAAERVSPARHLIGPRGRIHGGPAGNRAGKVGAGIATQRTVRRLQSKQLAQGVRERLDLVAGINPCRASDRWHDATLTNSSYVKTWKRSVSFRLYRLSDF
jgi:hypothetical protein